MYLQPRQYDGDLITKGVFSLMWHVRPWKVLASQQTHTVHVALPGVCSKNSRHMSAVLLRTAALYLAGEDKGEKFWKASKKLVTTFLVELLKLIGRKEKQRRGTKRKVRRGSIMKIREQPYYINRHTQVWHVRKVIGVQVIYCCWFFFRN